MRFPFLYKDQLMIVGDGLKVLGVLQKVNDEKKPVKIGFL